MGKILRAKVEKILQDVGQEGKNSAGQGGKDAMTQGKYDEEK